MSDFAETRLDIGMPVQAGGPMYRTKIIRTGYEFEKRWCQQSEWLYEGDLSEILLDQDQVKYLIAFLNARQGRQQGFRFRFWADYTATATPKDLGHSCTTQGVMAPLAGDGIRRVFKLLKRYSQGAHTSYKAIHKPDEVQVYINNAPVVAQYSAVSGIVVFNSPVPFGAVPTWAGTFDLPVRFDSDTIPAVQQFVQEPSEDNFYNEQLALFQVDSLPLIELELPMPSGIAMPTPALAPESNYRLEIGPSIGPTDAIGPTHNTLIKRLDSGFEKRTTYQAEPLLKGEINQSLLEDEQLEYVLCFFHCRRGRAQTFRWKYWADYQATAEETELDPFTTIQGVFAPEPNGTTNVFKFQKRYTQFGRAIRKGIQKLVQGTVTVFVGNAIATPTIDYEKGLVTFATAPATGSILTWDGEHDVEVRFDSDKAMLKSAVLNPENTVETAVSISYQFQNMAITEVLPTLPLGYDNLGNPDYSGIPSLACTASEFDVIFEDQTFNLSDYIFYTLTADTGGNYSFTQEPTGGNPGSFMKTSVTINQYTPPSGHSFMFVFAQKSGAIWNPSSGKILFIDYKEDNKFIGSINEGGTPGPSGQVCFLCLKQNNKIFVPASIFTGLNSNWQTFQQNGLLATNFVQAGNIIAGSTGIRFNPSLNVHPNFNSGGSTIKFGWARSQDAAPPGLDGYTRIAAIDNWRVRLRCRTN